MSKPLQTYAIGACEGLAEALENLTANGRVEVLGWSQQIADAAAPLTGAQLDVLLYAVAEPVFPAHGLATIREHTSAPVILVADTDCSAILDEALEAGVTDVIELPKDNLVFAIRKASSSVRRDQAGRSGRVLTVFCPKGGVGKTTTSVNLAACLAREHRKRTLLLDLDLQFGDTAIMLGLEPEKTIYDLMIAPGDLDAEKLAGYATRHASGADILPAPLLPEEADLVTEQKVARLIDVARDSYEAIVVDTAPFFHGPMLSTLDRTDDLLLLCGVDVPTIKNVRLGMNTLELLRFPRERMRIVLNRPNMKAGVSRGEIERVLESRVRFELPGDPGVLRCVNEGNPILLADRKAPYSAAIRKLAAALAGNPPPARKQPQRRFLGRAPADAQPAPTR
jgi:pilus assembly protein CpaE